MTSPASHSQDTSVLDQNLKETGYQQRAGPVIPEPLSQLAQLLGENPDGFFSMNL